jgi:hypothetical protein
MSLTTSIQTIVSTLYPDATFLLSSKFHANREALSVATSALPLIILDNELTKNVEIKKNNNIQKDTRVLISFLTQDTPNNTDLQTDAIREAMEVMADKVAVNIWQIAEVIPIGNQKYKLVPLFHVGPSNLSGVALDMLVNYNEVTNMCAI